MLLPDMPFGLVSCKLIGLLGLRNSKLPSERLDRILPGVLWLIRSALRQGSEGSVLKSQVAFGKSLRRRKTSSTASLSAKNKELQLGVTRNQASPNS